MTRLGAQDVITDQIGRNRAAAQLVRPERPRAPARPQRSPIWRAAAAILLCLATLGFGSAHADALDDLHQSIVRRHPQLSHVSPETLAAMAPEDVVLFDVRQPAEFAVSHIEGAILTVPGTGNDRFFQDNRERLKGKFLVFYCSVGVRSSALADRVRVKALENGASGVANLEGGVFRWHNETRPLVSADGPTDFVHPHDRFWKRLLARPALARSTPVSGDKARK